MNFGWTCLKTLTLLKAQHQKKTKKNHSIQAKAKTKTMTGTNMSTVSHMTPGTLKA